MFPQWVTNRLEIVAAEMPGITLPSITVFHDALTEDVIQTLEVQLEYMALNPDGRYFAGVESGYNGQTFVVTIWDIEGNSRLLSVEQLHTVENIIWHPFHNMLIVTTHDGDREHYFIDFYDVLTGEQLFSMLVDESILSLNSIGNLLAMESDGAITVRSLARNGDEITLEQVYEFSYEGVDLREVRWHQREDKMAAIGTVDDGETYLYFWDLSGAEPMMMTAAVPAEIVEFAWRPDGTITFATVDDDGVIHIWEEMP
jgi:WD40 repeat protein